MESNNSKVKSTPSFTEYLFLFSTDKKWNKDEEFNGNIGAS